MPHNYWTHEQDLAVLYGRSHTAATSIGIPIFGAWLMPWEGHTRHCACGKVILIP